jgi:virulence-associated protein VagC
MLGGDPVGEQRHIRLFCVRRNQAVRIPVEFELPGDEEVIFCPSIASYLLRASNRNGDRHD